MSDSLEIDVEKDKENDNQPKCDEQNKNNDSPLEKVKKKIARKI